MIFNLLDGHKLHLEQAERALIAATAQRMAYDVSETRVQEKWAQKAYNHAKSKWLTAIREAQVQELF